MISARHETLETIQDGKMSAAEFKAIQTNIFRGALQKIAFEEALPPADDDWREIKYAPKDGRPIWSKNTAMREPVISRRGHGGSRKLWTVLAEPFEEYPCVTGAMHCPTEWQPIIWRDADA